MIYPPVDDSHHRGTESLLPRSRLPLRLLPVERHLLAAAPGTMIVAARGIIGMENKSRGSLWELLLLQWEGRALKDWNETCKKR